MRLLLDTHALLWWLTDDLALGRRARAAIGNTANTVVVSAASAWEIATKFRIGKLPGAAEVATAFADHVAREGFETLAISVDHALRAGQLPGAHKDPFDRMLIAQCQAEHLVLASNEEVFDSYGVRRIW
jgi:PIN domain nuclease of toxin-antitoxin system